MDYQKAINNCNAMISDLRENPGDGIKVRQLRRTEIRTLETAISAMQELQEYHETGMTPREVIKMQHGYAVKMTDLEDYQQIGTLEEVREAVEKQKAKKPKNVEAEGYRYTDTYRCPACGGNFSGTGIADYCYHCGQHIDWSEEE